jgi:hypothetical protein
MFVQKQKHAKMLWWHKEDRKSDVMLKHQADGSQWRKIERESPDFRDDVRNLRFGLSTDDMNPFGPKWLPPKQVYTVKQKRLSTSFINQPLQYDLNKPDDYTRCLDKQVEASKTRSTSASEKRDVARLRE